MSDLREIITNADSSNVGTMLTKREYKPWSFLRSCYPAISIQACIPSVSSVYNHGIRHDKKAIETPWGRSKEIISLPQFLAITFRWPPCYSLALQDKSVVCLLFLMFSDDLN